VIAQPGESDPPAAAAEAATQDDLAEADLAVLGLGSEPDEDKLNIFGFVEVNWVDLMASRNSVWAGAQNHEGTFAVGNLDVYLTRNLGTAWRTLLELRYTYAPSGAVAADGTYTDSTSADPANFGRPVQWGGLVLERAYLEYDVAPWLTVQAGTFLTPYGIWNVDHGSPVIIPTVRPYIIGEQLFPERQTGIHAFGARPYGDFTVRYHATLSNGRGPLAGFRDLDTNKGIGGRLELETPWLGATHLGVSGYRGRFTDRPANQLGFDPLGRPFAIIPAGVSYDEESAGADVFIERDGLHLQGELIYNRRRYRGARPVFAGVAAEDDAYFGAYGLVGYRFERFWHVMPYALFEVDRPRADPMLPRGTVVYAAGLNLRPIPSVVLKLGLALVDLDDQVLDEPALYNSAQAAWVF
jgi:hypothetical protein